MRHPRGPDLPGAGAHLVLAKTPSRKHNGTPGRIRTWGNDLQGGIAVNPSQPSTRALALGALFAALVTGATLLSLPVPGFRLYFNLGEGVIYTVALLFGPRYGAAAGALGAALGDLVLGYPLWAPFSFVIKGLEGATVGFLGRRVHRGIALAAGALVARPARTVIARPVARTLAALDTARRGPGLCGGDPCAHRHAGHTHSDRDC